MQLGTSAPAIITKHSRPVAAIVDIEELQRLYDRLDELEELRDQCVVWEFQAAEARREIGWVSNDEMSTFVHGVIAEAKKGG